MSSRYDTAEWLELSGLPAHLNSKARAGAWPVFKALVEIDCKRHREPGTVEVSLEELGERTGLAPDKVGKILEALRKKKFVACFVPDNAEEQGLFQICVPITTPIPAKEVAERIRDPHLRDPSLYRYLTRPPGDAPQVKKIQAVVDLYLNTLSQKVNSFIVEEIEVLARRFPFEAIKKTIERGAKHEIRSISWVAKELIRDARRSEEKKGKDASPSPGQRPD